MIRILFNHHISGAADVMDLMRRACPDLFLIATHERRDTPIRLATDRFLQEPPETRGLAPDEYADWLLGVALAERAELVIPYRRRNQLAQFQALFSARGIRLLCAADAATMRLIDTKPQFLSRMANLGVPVTPHRLFQGLASYRELRAEGDLFPDHPGDLCVKPASGIYGAGFRVLRDAQARCGPFSALSSMELAEPAFQAMLAAIEEPEQMMLMPLLPGPERSIDFACHQGQLLGTVAREKTATSQRLHHDPFGEELAGLVTRTFGLTGVLNLQIMEDRAGTPRLLEVNSRSSGGIGMTGLTDVNLAGLLLDSLQGRQPSMPERVSKEVIAGRREIFWAV